MTALRATPHRRPTLDARRSTLDARRSTLDARRSTLDARRSTLDARRSTLDARRSTLDARRSTLDARRSTLDARRSTLDARRSTLDARRSTLDARRSTLDARRSTLDARRSTLDARRPPPDARRYFDAAASALIAADIACTRVGSFAPFTSASTCAASFVSDAPRAAPRLLLGRVERLRDRRRARRRQPVVAHQLIEVRPNHRERRRPHDLRLALRIVLRRTCTSFAAAISFAESLSLGVQLEDVEAARQLGRVDVCRSSSTRPTSRRSCRGCRDRPRAGAAAASTVGARRRIDRSAIEVRELERMIGIGEVASRRRRPDTSPAP